MPKWQKHTDARYSKALKRIRKVSKSMAKRKRAYNARVKAWLTDEHGQPMTCEVCFLRTATQCHHKRGRAGTLLEDERFWIRVCSVCHDWIHKHPKLAREAGLLAKAGEWNKPVPACSPLVTAKSLLEKLS